MKNLVVSLRIVLLAALAALMATPTHASLRSSIFGRSSRAMMGMSDGATGEIYTITPGVRSLRATVRRASGIGYGANGEGFNLRLARNGFPNSIRSNNGSRMTLVRLPGGTGGMRGFVRSLQGARVGQPFNVFPGGAGTLSERGGSTVDSFRFGGFDGTRFNRQQLIQDVPVFGPILAGLLNRGFGSVNLLLQRCSEAFDENGIPTDADLISGLMNSAAGNTISVFDGSDLSQEITNSSFDLLQYLRSLLNLLPGDVAALIERLLTRDLIAAFATEASLLSDLLTQLNDPNAATGDYSAIDPDSQGVIEFTDDRTAVLENAGASFIYLTRRDGSFGDVTATVTFDADNSTAVLNTDVRFRTQAVKWKTGESGPRAVAFTIVNDNANNGDVEFTLNVNVTAGDDSVGIGSAAVVIVDDDGTGGVAVARNTVLVCEYTWPRNRRDLDTGTTFLNETVGYGYADFAPYLLWTGDDTTTGGREVVVVDIDSAVANGDVPSTFDIDCFADWFGPAGGFGPATLSVYFREAFSTRTSPRVVKQIEPTPLTADGTYAHPSGSTMAITPVATVSVNFDDDAGIFTFDVDNGTD